MKNYILIIIVIACMTMVFCSGWIAGTTQEKRNSDIVVDSLETVINNLNNDCDYYDDEDDDADDDDDLDYD